MPREQAGDLPTGWLRAVRELGLPTVLVVMLLAGGWRITERFLDVHQHFVREMQESVKRAEASDAARTEMAQRILAIQEMQTRQQEQILSTQQTVIENQRTMIALLMKLTSK